MASRQAVPESFGSWVNLAADELGAFVLHATDDYFAPKENLLKPSAPEWREDEYTDKGKWMDGWESQRRRTPGHDVAWIRLGAPGRVGGVLVDTTHFKGNAPQEVELCGLEAPLTASASELQALEGWQVLIKRSPVKPNSPNVFRLPRLSPRVTHVRLSIFPDGGVARLRVHGEVEPEPWVFWRPGSIDLAAVEHGACIAASSDAFFGPPVNLLLPGRGVNMGDGWETKRRRTPGSDWSVIRLARRGRIERIELDTHFFKGNAPQATVMEALDASALSERELAKRLPSPHGWRTLVDRTPLVQHRRHLLEPVRPMEATHVRVHIFPHGGVNRLRLWGYAADSEAEWNALTALNRLSEAKAGELFVSFCGAPAWAGAMAAARPFESWREAFATAERLWWAQEEAQWQLAFAAHPQLGEQKKALTQTATSAGWSRNEQKQLGEAPAQTLARLAELNRAYAKKFGFIFICFASGKSAPQVLELLEERMKNARSVEVENAAIEQAKITRLRMEKWLLSALAQPRLRKAGG